MSTGPPMPPASAAGGAPAAARRAPRLSPDERIAGLMHRSGRFARIDPCQGAAHPSWAQATGVAAWAAFTGGCVWAAWRRRHR